MGRIIRDTRVRRDYWLDQFLSRGFLRETEHQTDEELGEMIHLKRGIFNVTLLAKSPLPSPLGCEAQIDVWIFPGLVHDGKGDPPCFSAHRTVLDIDDRDTLHVLDALADTDLLPTCVGIRWFGRLLETLLRTQCYENGIQG